MAAGDPGKVVVQNPSLSTIADYIVKQGDTASKIIANLSYNDDGTAVNLTGATVKFIMRSSTATTAAVNASMTIVGAATAGQVSYTFVAADIATPGLYQAVIQVTFSGGLIQTFPTDGYMDIWVESDLVTDTSVQLVTLSDAKDFLNIPAVDRSRDQKLMRWIAAARPVVELITGPIIPRVFDEWYDGGQYFVHLRHRPAFQLIAVSMYLGPVEYPLAVEPDPQHGTIYSVMLSPTGDRLVRRGPGGGIIGFPNMPDSVHVVYKAGQSTIPENVRFGTLQLIWDNWVDSQSPGWGRTGPTQDEEVSFHQVPEFLVSPVVREWLVPSRRHPSVF